MHINMKEYCRVCDAIISYFITDLKIRFILLQVVSNFLFFTENEQPRASLFFSWA